MNVETLCVDAHAHRIVDQSKGYERQEQGYDQQDQAYDGNNGVERVHRLLRINNVLHKRLVFDHRKVALQAISLRVVGFQKKLKLG